MTSSPASPLISIVTPVYNTPLYALEECIASVFAQTYTNWQLCLVDDLSPRQEIRDFLARAAKQDPRILVSYRQANGGIVAASNDAVALATGDYIGLLDHDDVLEPDALAEVVAALHADPSIDYIYTDEDLLTQDGTMRDPFRKPDWSPERFRNQMYVCHFSVIKTSLLRQVGGFRIGFDGSQDYDLMLRVTEQAHKVHHIPKILYHWRIVDGSVAADPTAKPYAYLAGQRAIEEHCHRVGIAADISSVTALPGNYRVVRRDDPDTPTITVLLVDTGAESSVWGDQRRHAPETAFHLQHMSTFPKLVVQVVPQGSQSRTEVLNRAVQECSTDFIVLASEALAVDTHNWCEILYGFARQADVGMAAPYIWTANSRLFHAGYLLRPHCIETAGARINKPFTGFRAVFKSDREVTALGTFCTMIRREAFLKVGGFDTSLPEPYASADLSLRLWNHGYRVIVTPQANMWCFEDNNDLSRGRHRMTDEFRRRWPREVEHDPYAGLPPENEKCEPTKPKWTPQKLQDFI